MNGISGGERPPWTWDVATAASLALLNMAAVASTFRLFDDGGGRPAWVRATFALIAIVHAVHFLFRRTRVPGAAVLATVVSLALGAAATARWFFVETTWAGVPTPSSAVEFASDLGRSLEPLGYEVAPIPLETPVAAAITLIAVLLATLTDSVAFVLRSRAATIAAPLGVFLFSSVIADGIDSTSTTVWVLGTAAVFWAAHVAFSLAGAGGAMAVRPATVRATFATGVVLSLLGGSAGLAVTDALSPESTDATLDLRSLGRAPAPRTVLSPLVRVSSLLRGNEGPATFTVRSERPHYWRLTALDRFDGDAWTSSATYDDLADGEAIDLPFSGGGPVESVRITLDDFETDWVPVPFAPTSATSDIDLRIDDLSSSLFVDDPEVGPDERWIDVKAVAPPGDGRGDGEDTPVLSDSERDRLLELSPETSATVAGIADELTSDDPDQLTTARRIQDYFRSPQRFRYDLFADYSSSADPIGDFLAEGAGFCQQFASTYAAVARQAGLPTRVAVGFTYGDSSGDGVWTVQARNAHAWPEVFIDGTGWLPFEPTPGRGNPDVVEMTGVPAQQDDGGSAATDPTTTTIPEGSVTPSTVAAPVVPTTAVPPSGPPTPPEGSTPEVDSPRSFAQSLFLAFLVILALGSAAAVGRRATVAVRRRRPTTGDQDPNLAVAELYRFAVADAARAGVPSGAGDTPRHFGAVASHALDVPEMEHLGRLESDRRYSPVEPDRDDVAAAAGALAAVDEAVRRRLGFTGRIRWALDI